jgi:hypothetical protein
MDFSGHNSSLPDDNSGILKVLSEQLLREKQELELRIGNSISLDSISGAKIQTLIMKHLYDAMTLKKDLLRSSPSHGAFPAIFIQEQDLKEQIRQQIPLAPWSDLKKPFESNLNKVITRLIEKKIIDRVADTSQSNLIIYPSQGNHSNQVRGNLGRKKGQDLAAGAIIFPAEVKLSPLEASFLSFIEARIKYSKGKPVFVSHIKAKYLGIAPNLKSKNMTEKQRSENMKFGELLLALERKGFLTLSIDAKSSKRNPEVIIKLNGES